MSDIDELISDEIIEPIEFDLAHGAMIRVALGYFWTKVNDFDQSIGIKPERYFAMRFYTDEGTGARRFRQFHELTHGKEFEYKFCPKIWRWLLDHATSRQRFDHEDSDGFVTAFEEVIDRIHAEDDDMIEHLERLPLLTYPDAFDRIDDSVFNDQTDPEIRH